MSEQYVFQMALPFLISDTTVARWHATYNTALQAAMHHHIGMCGGVQHVSTVALEACARVAVCMANITHGELYACAIPTSDIHVKT